MANIPLRPRGVKFYGAHIAVRPLGPTDGTTGTWMELWENFDLAYFEEQADLVQSLGGNLVSIIGDVQWIYDSAMSLETYLSNRRAVAQMLADKGMFFYPYGASGYHNWGTTYSHGADAAAAIAADAAMLSEFPNCIGYALMDEPCLEMNNGASLGDITTSQAMIYNACRAVVPSNFSLAVNCPAGVTATSADFSTTATSHGTAAGAILAALVPYCDHFSIHVFYANLQASHYATLLATYSKDLLFASCGRDLMTPIWPRATEQRGAIVWVAKDYVTEDATEAQKGGLFDLDNNPRTTATNAFTAAVTGPYPSKTTRRYSGNPRLNELTRWQYI